MTQCTRNAGVDQTVNMKRKRTVTEKMIQLCWMYFEEKSQKYV